MISDWAAERGMKWAASIDGTEAMLKPVDEPLIDALDLNAPLKVADIACGGGKTTLEIAGRAPAGSVVAGFDISPALVELAHNRARSAQSIATFAVVDIESASPPEQYDRLASRFGVMFFRDPLAAFSNVRAWLAPDGRFAFAVWGPSAQNPWQLYVREAVSEVVELPPADPDGPGPFRYGDVQKLVSLLTEAGFGGVDVRTWRGAFSIGGGLPAAEAAAFALESFSSHSELLAQAGAKAREEAHELVAARLAPYEVDGTVRLEACAHIVTGTRGAT